MRWLLRADAGPEMGTGHVVRLLSLVETAGGRVDEATLAACRLPEGLRRRAKATGIDVVDLDTEPGSDGDREATRDAAADRDADWVLLDGYGFDAAFQARLGEVASVLLVDDLAHLDRYEADVVVNPNPHAPRLSYDAPDRTRLLLGSDHAILDPSFREHRDPSRPVPGRAERLLVTLGGSDPDDATSRILDALRDVDADLTVRVVVGGSNPREAAIRELAGDLPGPARVEADVDEMASRMAWADLAVASAGVTASELASMGVPSLLVVLADNQAPIARAMADRGAAERLGRVQELESGAVRRAVEALAGDADRRARMAEAGRSLVDGRGAQRVVEAMDT